jgi:hypothetical protein
VSFVFLMVFNVCAINELSAALGIKCFSITKKSA